MVKTVDWMHWSIITLFVMMRGGASEKKTCRFTRNNHKGCRHYSTCNDQSNDFDLSGDSLQSTLIGSKHRLARAELLFPTQGVRMQICRHHQHP